MSCMSRYQCLLGKGGVNWFLQRTAGSIWSDNIWGLVRKGEILQKDGRKGNQECQEMSVSGLYCNLWLCRNHMAIRWWREQRAAEATPARKLSVEVPGRVNQPGEFTQAWLRHVHVRCCHASGLELKCMIQSEETSLSPKKTVLLWFQNKCFSTSKPPICTAPSSPLYTCSANNNDCLYQNTSTWDWALSLPSVPQLFSVPVLPGKTMKIFKHFLSLSEHWLWSQWHISVYPRKPLWSAFPSLRGNDEWRYVCESW